MDALPHPSYNKAIEILRKKVDMMDWPAALQLVSCILSSLVGICYFYQLAYLFLPFFKKPRPHKPEKLHRYAVLIAARNEEAVLPQLLWSILQQDYPQALITTYVVADNCTDGTAQVAAGYGAKVFERFDRKRIGKGYALHDLLEHIRASADYLQYDAFLIFDADNLLEPDYIRQINRTCSDGYDAFCGYRNSKNFGSSWVSAGHSVWFLHECVHLCRSRLSVGLPCAVTGTGFGFTRELLETMDGWNFFTLTEDIQFSVWCATRGIRVGYCQDATLYDEQPVTLRQSFRQRIRWVQGTIQVSVHHGSDMLRGMARGGKTGLASLETFTLSLWGFLMSGTAGSLGFIAAALNGGIRTALMGLLLSAAFLLVVMLVTAGLVLLTERRRIRATRRQKWMGLLAFPLYMLCYIPICVAALFRKPQWKPITHTAVSAETLLQ